MDLETTTFIWNIKNFNEIVMTKNELHSPEFPSEGNVANDWNIVLKWSKQIYCGNCGSHSNSVCSECHHENDEGNVSIYLWFPRLNKNLPPLKVKYILKNNNNDNCFKRSTIFCVQSEQLSQSGFRNFIALNQLKNFIENDDLTITCIIKQAFKPILTGFEDFVSKKFLSDFEFHICDVVIPAHKIVMSSKRPVFKSMFTHRMKENIDNVVEIVDIDFNVFYQFLVYMYNGRVRNLNQYASSLLIVANKYVVTSLITVCETYLQKNVRIDNVVEILKIADKVHSFCLIENCHTFITNNFNENVNSKQLETLCNSMPLLIKVAEEYFTSWNLKTIDDSFENIDRAEQKNEGFEIFFNENIWSDVNIKNNGTIYNAHKIVLSAKSEVFRKMLIDLEGHVNIDIDDIEPLVFLQFLRFIYTGFVENIEEICYELFIASDKYEISSLKRICENELISKLTCQNVISMLIIGENHKAFKLKECCMLFLIRKLLSGILGIDVLQKLSKNHPQLILDLLTTAAKKCVYDS